MASDRDIVDWYNLTPATPVGLRKSFFRLPTFNLPSLIWKGASEIVRQFNYSATKDFVLRARPTKPTGINWGACIKYREQDTVTRYKLWDDENLVLSGIELYNGQKIRKNFCIEAWSFNGETTAINPTEILMLSGEKKAPSLDIRNNVADFENLVLAQTVTPDVSPTMRPELDFTPVGWFTGDNIEAIELLGGVAGTQINDISGKNLQIVQDSSSIGGYLLYNDVITSLINKYFSVTAAPPLIPVTAGYEIPAVTTNGFICVFTVLAAPTVAATLISENNGTNDILTTDGTNFLFRWPGGLSAATSVVLPVGGIYALVADDYPAADLQPSMSLYDVVNGIVLATWSGASANINLTNFRFTTSNYGLIGYFELIFKMDATKPLAGEALEYVYDKYSLNPDQSTFLFTNTDTAWLDNADDSVAAAATSVNAPVVNLADRGFFDSFYLRDPNTGNYYNVVMEIVNGTPTLQVRDTPVTP